MSERLTPEARDVLNRYLEEVRHTMRGSEVDAEEVSADVRDHVAEAIAASGMERMDRAALEHVLERLGPPTGWLPEPEHPGWRRLLNPRDERSAPWLAAAVFSLTLLGVGLIAWAGPLVLLAAWVLARWVLALFESAGRSVGGWAWLIYPPLLLVGAGIGGVLLFWPAPPLFDAAAGVEPMLRAWAVVIFGVGAWWLVFGFIIHLRAAWFRWLLSPMNLLPRHGLVLAATGLALAMGAALMALVPG